MSHLVIEPTTFRDKFDRRAFALRHDLVDHPLFSLERLVELAQTLPADEIEYNPGDVPISLAPEQTPQSGLSVEETIHRIKECNSWMVLKRVERDPEYRALLDACLDQVRQHSESMHPNMHQREGFIFVSSPGAITPFHMDPELNVLLQIRGDKIMRVWDPNDRQVISELTLERYFASSKHRNLVYKDDYGPRADSFALSPGDAVHVPMAVPHWVEVGSEFSISFSITFRTDRSNQRERLYQINSRLRRMGLSPRPVGQSQTVDAMKLRLYSAYTRAKGLVPRLTR